ncbi:MAG: hypothetical protein PHG00_17680 [Methylococcales bacterium]|nr:hypothetical protein [Methylococcales bacterium]
MTAAPAVTVPEALVTVTLLKVVALLMVCAAVPVKSIVLVPAVNVPAFVQSPLTLKVLPQGLSVPVIVTEPAVAAVSAKIYVVVAAGITTGDVLVGTPPQPQLAATCQLLVGSVLAKVQVPAEAE